MKCRNILMLLILSLCFFIVGCNNSNQNTNQSSTSTPPSKPASIHYTATVTYVFNDFNISTSTFSITSEQLSDKPYITSQLKLPSEYVRADDEIYLTKTDSTSNKKYYKVNVKPKYDGYIIVRSSDITIDNKLVPASILSDNLSAAVKTVTTYDGELATYSLSNITEIKFKNSSKINANFKTSEYNWSSLINLTKIDVSELVYLKEIPTNFFAFCKNLHTVETGTAGFKNVIHIGSKFLMGTDLKQCEFDFSNVTTIGDNFLHSALRNLSGNAKIVFRDLDPTSGDSVLYQNEMAAGTYIDLYLNKIIPTNNWFHKNNSINYSTTPNFIQTTIWAYTIQGKVIIHSAYKPQVETVVSSLNSNGGTITVVDM